MSSFISIKDYTIPAGEWLYLGVRAKFFMLMESTKDVDFKVLKSNTEIGYGESVIQGASHGPSAEPFDGIWVKTTDGSSQTVKICLADGLAELRSIVGAVSLTGGTVDAVTAITNPPTPRTLVDQWGGLITNAVSTIITPAANTGGVRVDNVSMLQWLTTGQVNVVAKSSAPSGFNDTTSHVMWFAKLDAGLYSAEKANLPVIVPAGLGIYAIADVVDLCRISTSYEGL